mmetsp:Transcript_13813/g.39707  ORF Transcript_13813/g.39707 Transcript_13813/m.39707 type:complete len:242 (+) Transcript_13813:1461-2186(+)
MNQCTSPRIRNQFGRRRHTACLADSSTCIKVPQRLFGAHTLTSAGCSRCHEPQSACVGFTLGFGLSRLCTGRGSLVFLFLASIFISSRRRRANGGCSNSISLPPHSLPTTPARSGTSSTSSSACGGWGRLGNRYGRKRIEGRHVLIRIIVVASPILGRCSLLGSCPAANGFQTWHTIVVIIVVIVRSVRCRSLLLLQGHLDGHSHIEIINILVIVVVILVRGIAGSATASGGTNGLEPGHT